MDSTHVITGSYSAFKKGAQQQLQWAVAAQQQLQLCPTADAMPTAAAIESLQ